MLIYHFALCFNRDKRVNSNRKIHQFLACRTFNTALMAYLESQEFLDNDQFEAPDSATTVVAAWKEFTDTTEGYCSTDILCGKEDPGQRPQAMQDYYNLVAWVMTSPRDHLPLWGYYEALARQTVMSKSGMAPSNKFTEVLGPKCEAYVRFYLDR